MVKKVKAFHFLVIMSILFSCRGNFQSYEDYEEKPAPKIRDIIGEENPSESIIYQVKLPLELASLFKNSNAVYNPKLLLPVEKSNGFAGSNKIALNLGIYGVDLNYCRLFEEYQKSFEYMTVLHELSSQLGIPDEFFSEAADQFEEHMGNKDSILNVVKTVFIKSDTYLKESGQETAAALIMLGGWVESLYISTCIYKNDTSNTGLRDKIAMQKYSLNSLISFLYNFQSDVTVAKYIILLKLLKSDYDKVLVVHEEGEFKIDTLSRTISAEEIRVNFNEQDFQKLIANIHAIRNEIVR